MNLERRCVVNIFDGDNSLRHKILLSERDWQAFSQALEQDREPSEAAMKAAARYNEGHREGTRYVWESSSDQEIA